MEADQNSPDPIKELLEHFFLRSSEIISTPKIEISDAGESYFLTAELPGVDEGDIDITVLDGTLIIEGKRKMRTRGRGLISEFEYGEFSRPIPLGTDIDLDKTSARYIDGLLEITLPKFALS